MAISFPTQSSLIPSRPLPSETAAPVLQSQTTPPPSSEKTQTAQPYKPFHQADQFEAAPEGRGKVDLGQKYGAGVGDLAGEAAEKAVDLAAGTGTSNSSNADSFNTMLQQFNELQQQTMTENLEMQKAQAFWNPLESMSKKDATS